MPNDGFDNQYQSRRFLLKKWACWVYSSFHFKGHDGTGYRHVLYLLCTTSALQLIKKAYIYTARAAWGNLAMMVVTIGQSRGKKILLPINRCNTHVIGMREQPLGEYIRLIPAQLQ